jgi:murein L,D-transpeptidase YcbB/YkuD
MKRFSVLVITSAVAAAMAVPVALAQTGDGSAAGQPKAPRAPERSATDGRSGGTGPLSGTPMPSTRESGAMRQDASTVREVQQALRDKGFEVGPVDGVMGPRTEAAVREFQQKEGLQASGRLDQRTLAALNVDAAGSSMGSPGQSGDGSNQGGVTGRDRRTGAGG